VTGRRVPVVTGAEMTGAMEIVVRGYLEFSRRGPEPGAADPAKAFAAHHAACKAALAHLEALMKVMRSAGAATPEEETQAMLIEARAEIAQLPEDETDGGEQC
jgi:hypothetical protein